jgi:PAS domain S-box-containing protein
MILPGTLMPRTSIRRFKRRMHETSKAPAPDVTEVPAACSGAEDLLRSTLDALSAHVAVLDASGTILFVNRAWQGFARSSGFGEQAYGVGLNYLAVCERAAEASPDAARVAVALREIMDGQRSGFRMEYPCACPDGVRWFQVRITPADWPHVQRIAVAHEDITDVKSAEAQLTRLSARLMQVQDEERRAIARDLHDTTAQNLLAVTLNATRLREALTGAHSSAQDILAEILSLAEQSLREVRTLSYLLHPPLLEEMGLGPALKWLAKGFSERSKIPVETRIAATNKMLPLETATVLFRVAQEALANIHCHSGSPWAVLKLRSGRGAIHLEIEDGGCGLKAPLTSGDEMLGVGLAGMRVRVEQIGGQLDIRSSKTGTRIRATVRHSQTTSN